MDIDLLSDEPTPTTEVPLEATAALEQRLAESLDGLQIENTAESREAFGDFTQQTGTWQPFSQPTGSSHVNDKKHAPAALNLEFATARSELLLPYIPHDLIPPPPMSATPPRASLPGTPPVASAQISRRNTTVLKAKSAMDIAADQVLDWLEPAQVAAKSDAVAMSIGGAWESALELMGNQVHTAEVAKRLCGVLDEFPLLPVGDSVGDMAIDADFWAESACGASAGVLDNRQHRSTKEKDMSLRISELVWPEHTQPASDGSLVAAYLKLAELAKEQETSV
ncbi:hypothetical protein IW152_003766 [Coemansia sp. BCRC 34962]|nr:hypothetical protein IW152_003766 [Coemansia sp. BCRC 34962]